MIWIILYIIVGIIMSYYILKQYDDYTQLEIASICTTMTLFWPITILIIAIVITIEVFENMWD